MKEEPLARIGKKLKGLAVPMKEYEFTQTTFKKIFPSGRVETPLGKVKLGENQYQKLEAKGRQEYLGAVFQTLSDPIFVAESEKNGKKANLYVKSFTKGKKPQIVISVVADINGKQVSISTHRRDMNNALNIIKKGNILYEKDVAKTVDTGAFNSPSSEERQPTDKAYFQTE